MSGMGKSTAAKFFTSRRIGQTGIAFADSDAALSDPTLDDQDREIPRTALSSTFGGKLTKAMGTKWILTMIMKKTPTHCISRSALRAVPHAKTYVWRDIEQAHSHHYATEP